MRAGVSTDLRQPSAHPIPARTYPLPEGEEQMQMQIQRPSPQSAPGVPAEEEMQRSISCDQVCSLKTKSNFFIPALFAPDQIHPAFPTGA